MPGDAVFLYFHEHCNFLFALIITLAVRHVWPRQTDLPFPPLPFHQNLGLRVV